MELIITDKQSKILFLHTFRKQKVKILLHIVIFYDTNYLAVQTAAVKLIFIFYSD